MKETPPWAAAIIAVILQIIVLIYAEYHGFWNNFLPFLNWGFAFCSIYLVTKSRHKDSHWFATLVSWIAVNVLLWLIPSWLKPGWLILLITLPSATWLIWRHGIMSELGIKHERLPEPPPIKTPLPRGASSEARERSSQTTPTTISGYLVCHNCEAVAMTKTHCLACGVNAESEPSKTKKKEMRKKGGKNRKITNL